MREVEYLWRGLVIGFAIAAPVGPIGLLCIQRTLSRGRLVGLVSGLGAATADAIYGSLAAFGLTAVSGALIAYQLWLRLVGGVFLLVLGARTFAAPVADRPAVDQGRGLIGAYASTFGLTLTNPMTILSFVAVFTGLGVVGGRGTYRQAATLVGGVFSGSAAWWLTLTTVVGVARSRVGPGALRWVNRLAGLAIVAFGVVVLVGAV